MHPSFLPIWLYPDHHRILLHSPTTLVGTLLLCSLFLTLSDSWTALLGLLPISNRQFQWRQDTSPPPTNLGNFVHVLENSVITDAYSPQSISPNATVLWSNANDFLWVEGSLPSELLPAPPLYAGCDYLGFLMVGAGFALTVWDQEGKGGICFFDLWLIFGCVCLCMFLCIGMHVQPSKCYGQHLPVLIFDYKQAINVNYVYINYHMTKAFQ